jgi:hypothetical protein
MTVSYMPLITTAEGNIITSSQVGSKQNGIEYKNTANTIYVGANITATKKLSINGNLAYNILKGYMNGPNYGDSVFTDLKLA